MSALLANVWVLHVACATAYLGMAAFILGRGAETRLNQGAVAINVTFLLWSTCLAVSHFPGTSKETAELFYSLGSFAWGSFASVAVFFIATFLRPSILRRRSVQAALVIPPLLVVFAQWAGFLAEDYVKRPWGYAFVWRSGFWSTFFFTFYGLYMTAGLGLMLYVSFLPAHPIRKRQARIISLTAIVPLMLSTTTDVVLPTFHDFDIPNMAPDFTVIWVIGLVYAIARHRMLELTPAVAADRIVATMSEALLLTDPNGYVLLANPAASHLLGYPLRELQDSHLSDLVVGVSEDEVLADTGEPRELVLRRRDGEEVNVLFSASQLKGSTGETLGVVCAASDIGTLKQTQEALRRARDDLERRVEERTQELSRTNEQLSREVIERKLSEGRYRLLIETMQEGLWVLDAQDKTALVNRGLVRVIGFGIDDLRGRSVLEFLDDPDVAAGALKDARAGQSTRGDWVLRCRHGLRVDAIVNVAPLMQGDSYAGAVLTVVDVTERKRLQSQLARADRLASLGRLAAGVGHEVNNPLTWVLDNLEQVQTTLNEGMALADREQASQSIAEALDGARRVRDIVKELSAFSRGGAPEAELVNLEDVIEEAIKISDKEIRFRSRLTREFGRTPRVLASPGRLVQVFVNLLVNAAHAIDSGGVKDNEIRVRTWYEQGRVHAEIRDTGHGIAESDIGRLFDPFFTTKAKGEGLGLSISHEIVSQCGGRIDVVSEEGKGTTFTVVLPASAETPSTRPLPRAHAALLSGARVLVVDDEPALRRTLRRTLGRENEVVLAASGEEALTLLEKEPAFDVVLCDLMMPGFSGIDLYEHLVKNRPEVAARMVFMTGGAFTARAEEFLRDGNRPLIAKPFETKELLQTLGDVVG